MALPKKKGPCKKLPNVSNDNDMYSWEELKTMYFTKPGLCGKNDLDRNKNLKMTVRNLKLTLKRVPSNSGHRGVTGHSSTIRPDDYVYTLMNYWYPNMFKAYKVEKKEGSKLTKDRKLDRVISGDDGGLDIGMDFDGMDDNGGGGPINQPQQQQHNDQRAGNNPYGQDHQQQHHYIQRYATWVQDVQAEDDYRMYSLKHIQKGLLITLPV